MPGGVGIYWICSNLIAIIQTIVLNAIYNPAKIRAQAEAEYEERRRKKAEDKKRLAEARKREQSELQKMINEENGSSGKKKKNGSKGKPVKAPKPEETPTEETDAVTESPEPPAGHEAETNADA